MQLIWLIPKNNPYCQVQFEFSTPNYYQQSFAVSNELILADRIGKKFHRTLGSAILHGVKTLIRRVLHLRPSETLGKDEFWALQEVSFIVKRGECLGVIGPNGAGKSTLLKLIHREFRADAGRILTLGSVTSLLRIDFGLQPLLSGRENIYIRCHQMGLSKVETDAKVAEIIRFAGLEHAIDAQVKTYSDGMYARLEFAIATSVQPDILLVDEVLAVGDIAFQIKALDRLNQLKRNGTAIVFVSHSEMNVRHVADRCLLLFNGRQVALGEPDALFYTYYESVGYLNHRLQPLHDTMQTFQDVSGALSINSLRKPLAFTDEMTVRVGQSIEWLLEYAAGEDFLTVDLSLQFWSLGDMLVASITTGLTKEDFRLTSGKGSILVRIPFMSLTPGCYRVAAGLSRNGQWLAYRSHLSTLYVIQNEMNAYNGLIIMQAMFEQR